MLYGLKGTHFRVLFGIWGDFFAARCCVSLMFQENGCLSPWYKGINTYIPLPIVFIHCNFHWCQLLTNRVFCSLPGDLSQLGIMLVSIIDLWNIMICHTNNLCLSMAKYIWSNNSRNIPYMVSVVLMTPDQAILPTVRKPIFQNDRKWSCDSLKEASIQPLHRTVFKMAKFQVVFF